uniref:Uncharacterized protein n=1 Tax=Timema bartmani TaxID=61472 RepID=A0A7R9ERH8_9NEOP|nr:unnamed protein product [Timema bartmani]
MRAGNPCSICPVASTIYVFRDPSVLFGVLVPPTIPKSNKTGFITLSPLPPFRFCIKGSGSALGSNRMILFNLKKNKTAKASVTITIDWNTDGGEIMVRILAGCTEDKERQAMSKSYAESALGAYKLIPVRGHSMSPVSPQFLQFAVFAVCRRLE